MYVAMVYAGLTLSLAILFGVIKLLQGYWHPIQWAILCYMPLRKFHTTLVSFWSHSLNLDLFDTLIIVPFAALRASTCFLIDSHTVFLSIFCNHPKSHRRKKIVFFKLVQWLFFALFLTIYESIGLVPIFAFVVACFMAYYMGWKTKTNPGLKTTLSAISYVRRRGSKIFCNNGSLLWKMCKYITYVILNKLKTMVEIGLIMFMILGSMFGFLFFLYKIAMEGKILKYFFSILEVSLITSLSTTRKLAKGEKHESGGSHQKGGEVVKVPMMTSIV